MRCLILIALGLAVASATRFDSCRRRNTWWGANDRYNHDGRMDMDDEDVDFDSDRWTQRRPYGRSMLRRGQWMDRETELDFANEFDNVDDEYQTVYGKQQQQQLKCKPAFELLPELEEANHKLAAKLYQQIKEERDDKNVVVSPVSVQLGLAALTLGAKGNTKQQILRTIAGGRLQEIEQHQTLAALHRVLKGQRQGQKLTKINTLTGIIVNQESRAQRQFIQLVRNCQQQHADVKMCDFQRQPTQCTKMINRWAEQKTNGKIHHIVPQDAVTTNTKMVVVNALNVQARWEKTFPRQQTTVGQFCPLGSQQCRRVKTLQTQDTFKYYEDEQVQVLGLPTEQDELTMYVVLPKEKDGLNQVEKERLQQAENLKQLLDITDNKERMVDVQLPKFTVKHIIDAKLALKKQGVQDAFDGLRADFSAISGQYLYQSQEQTEQIHLNKFIHKTSIKVTEQGIQTAFGARMDNEEEFDVIRSRRDEREFYPRSRFGGAEKEFVADHAFAFVVKHNPSQQVLMMGRIVDAAQMPQQQQHQLYERQQMNIHIDDQL